MAQTLTALGLKFEKRVFGEELLKEEQTKWAKQKCGNH